MTEETRDTDRNGLTYRQAGDYLIPNLEMDDAQETRPLGKYAMMRRSYLEEHRKALFETLLLKGQLRSHLADIEETAHQRVEAIMAEMLEKDPPPDKAANQMGWVQHMNMTKALAEEMIMELIQE
jgi:hypothetical protein